MKFLSSMVFILMFVCSFGFAEQAKNVEDGNACLEDSSSMACTHAQMQFMEMLAAHANKQKMLSREKQADQVEQYGILLGMDYTFPSVAEVVADLAKVYNGKIMKYGDFAQSVGNGGKTDDKKLLCLQSNYLTLLRMRMIMPSVYRAIMAMAIINQVPPCELHDYVSNFAATLQTIPTNTTNPMPKAN